jgi:hypothetical protein
MIARRTVLGGGLALMVPGLILPELARAGIQGMPATRQLGFDVWRGSRQLGTHELVFHPRPDGFVVDVTVDIAFRVGPITLFRYSHHAQERWANGQVVELTSQTDDNGTSHRVTGRRDGAGLVIQADRAAPYTAPADALPATHWNHRELDGPWINTQSGELIRPHVAPEAPAIVETANAGHLHVRRYALSGPVNMELWYDDAFTWAGLSFVKGGAQVRYARRA